MARGRLITMSATAALCAAVVVVAAAFAGARRDDAGVPAGRQELVHHANADRRLLEGRYDSNASCVGIDLAWPGGRPAIEQSVCAAGDDG
jgi:hypothetical protein